MRLVELEPRWWAQEGRHGQGVSFRCPCPKCLADPERAVRLGVAFDEPLDGGGPFPLPASRKAFQGKSIDVTPSCCWGRHGDTFDTLTLSPSVDASASGHWHGYVTNGEIR